jgi:ABC-2 type transport system ATP-binding protein
LTATDATRAMAAVFDALVARGVPTRAASVARPTLDDVFMRHTGSTIRDAEENSATTRNRMIMQVMAGGRR